MLSIKITNTDSKTFPITNNLFQTPFWGSFKQKFFQTPFYFWVEILNNSESECKSEKIIFPLLVLIRKLSAKSTDDNLYAYIPRVPNFSKVNFENNIFLEELSEALKVQLPENCVLIKYDLSSVENRSADKSDVLRKDLLELKMNYGTKNHNFYKSVTNYLCADTVIINLELSLTRLLKNMRQQTRNSIRRAYKEEVVFSIFDAAHPDLKNELCIWHKIYEETAARKNFYSEKLSYFETLFETSIQPLPENKSFSNKKESETIPLNSVAPRPKIFLFTASKNKTMLSGLILAISGQCAYYMYAASCLEGRECMPNYGLQWEVISFARSKGCTEYDLMGIPPNNDKINAMSGLYIFKTGFGGEQVHFDGTWDYPLNQEKYKNYRLQEYLALKM